MSHSRILILDPAGNMWGSERVLLDFLRSKAAKQRDIALCCPPGTPLALEAMECGVSVHPTFIANLHERSKAARLFAAIRLFIACKRTRADVIYVNQAGATRVALLAGRLAQIPVVPHVRLLEDVRYIEKLNASRRRLPFIVAVSKFIGAAFEHAETKHKVTVLYDAFDAGHFDAPASTASGTSIDFCCAGRLVPNKGQRALVEACALLVRAGVQIKLNLYGEGLPGRQYEHDLRGLVSTLQLESDVTFHGYSSDVVSEMRRHRAVVVPSNLEPLGRVVLEAWMAGTIPIVGATSGGAAEVIRASNGGLLYGSQSSQTIADAMLTCLQMSPEQRERMIKSGREWMRLHCDVEQYSLKIFELLDAAMDKYGQA